MQLDDRKELLAHLFFCNFVLAQIEKCSLERNRYLPERQNCNPKIQLNRENRTHTKRTKHNQTERSRAVFQIRRTDKTEIKPARE